MPEIPRAAMRLAARCLSDIAEQERFLACIGEGKSAEPAILWFAEQASSPFVARDAAPWQPPVLHPVRMKIGMTSSLKLMGRSTVA